GNFIRGCAALLLGEVVSPFPMASVQTTKYRSVSSALPDPIMKSSRWWFPVSAVTIRMALDRFAFSVPWLTYEIAHGMTLVGWLIGAVRARAARDEDAQDKAAQGRHDQASHGRSSSSRVAAWRHRTTRELLSGGRQPDELPLQRVDQREVAAGVVVAAPLAGGQLEAASCVR